MERTKYINFFEEIKKFKKKQQAQKKRGLNDYNLLTTVLKPHDEVRLHSRVIGSLLNPNGLHYQETLFLEKFFELVFVQKFDLNLQETTVSLEYHDIDIYITDGIKHIILENKIWADDQPCQIIKYINIIQEANDLACSLDEIAKIDDIEVIYLTPRDKDLPEEHTKDKDDFIYFSGTEQKLKTCSEKDNTKKLVPSGLKNYKVHYNKISYQKEILEWLKICKHEIQNITNLNESVSQYISVVEKITKTYTSKVGEMNEIILQEKENLIIAHEITESFNKIRPKIIKDFFTETLKEYFEAMFENPQYENYKIVIYEDKLDQNHSYPIQITHKDKDWKIVFQFGFTVKNMNRGYYGIAKFDKDVPLEKFRETMYPKLKFLQKNSTWSIFWNYTPRQHSYSIDNIISFKYEAEKVAKEYFLLFEKTLLELKKIDNLTLDKLNDDLENFISLEKNNDTI